MFQSQVLKCYELPYCTLQILTQNRFQLRIENFNHGCEPTLEISSDRAQLLPLAKIAKNHLNSISHSTNQQQVKPNRFSLHFTLDETPDCVQLSWEQLSDLVKILEAYQSDLEKNPRFLGKPQYYTFRVAALLVLIMGGILTAVQIKKHDALTSAAQSSNSSVTPTQGADRASSEPISNLPSPEPPQKPELKLSDPLDKLDQLFPPAAITTPPAQTTSDPPPPLKPIPTPEPIAPIPSVSSTLPNLPATPPNRAGSQTPQLEDIRTYFQSRWDPPADLKQDLEYHMIINRNGSLETIVPLGIAAKNYLSTVPFPQQDQPFVSPGSTAQKIRLVVRSNGQIKTFLIRDN